MNRRPATQVRPVAALTALMALALVPAGVSMAADTDIYGAPGGATARPNVIFLLDNTSNWSANNQAWKKSGVDAKCNALADPDETETCLGYSNQIFDGAASLVQGQIQLRALRLVFNELVCNGRAGALKVNVGLSLMGSQSVLSNGHGVGIINFAVQELAGTASTAGSTCKALIDQLDLIDAKVQDPKWKAPSSANYGAAYYEIFKYFGGHTNPSLAPQPDPNGASPRGATAYGPVRYSKQDTTLDDRNAFSNYSSGVYRSPITSSTACGNNYVVMVGNTYPNAEPSNGGPTVFRGLGYTPPSLSSVTSDTSRLADEWSGFLANTDVSPEPGIQRVFTYAVNTYLNKPDADQAKLLKSMAAEGGVGATAYIEVGGDLYRLIKGFADILINIASVDSVFTATTLPVSTTTQGTFLNQIFVGMFRPDEKGSPRWIGNLKQFQLGFVNGTTLAMVDRNGDAAVQSDTGLFKAGSRSFWTEPSVFFDQMPSGTPKSASDSPDGSIVDKGGAAQRLREANLKGSSGRNVKILNSAGLALVDFNALNSGLSGAEVAWIRGENNVDSGPGMERFVGTYMSGSTKTAMTTATTLTGVRASVHGDVLHSRPVALNYGSGGVVVYYGSNDGFFRAIDGTKVGGGGEYWSFLAREHFGLQTRLRKGTPTVHLPETDSTGATVPPPSADFEPKDYGMDGPIGVYALYDSAGSVTKAWIYPTMRRGGNSVYAFDVSNKTLPLFKWRIQGGTAPYTELAQTWSMPKAVVTSTTSATQPPILIMGGGYDPAEDTNTSSGIGNRVYIINGHTGALIHAFTTQYSVPSDITVVDVNGDGEPDRAYAVDVRGNIYRIEFPTTGDITQSTTWSSASITKIGEAGGKVFYAPEVVVTKKFVAVLVGTGDREKPLLVSTTDRFVMFKDEVAAGDIPGRTYPLRISDLTRVARIDNATMQPADTNNGAADAEGCYIQLATNGEKVVNAPFTIAGATYFGTNRPTPAGAPICKADLGQAFAYKFPLFCGVPAAPTPIVSGGLPPSPVGGIVTIDIGGVPTQVPFLIGGTGPSPFDVAEPKPPIPPIRTRQNWRIDNNR